MISRELEVCLSCIRNRFHEVKSHIESVHTRIRKRFGLPPLPPRDRGGIKCNICFRQCQIGDQGVSYCGLRRNVQGQLKGANEEKGNLSWYKDSLPTNCVGNWVCPGGTGCGYPQWAYRDGPEYGYKNLAVFYHGCSFHCLFCQNWHHFEMAIKSARVSTYDLASAVDHQTSCICYFGGDPTPQIQHSLETSRIVLENNRGRILRICWETNGSMHPHKLKEMIEIALISGGCIKFDLKTASEELSFALSGGSNKRSWDNFYYAASRMKERPVPPLIIASTPLIPGYIDTEEIYQIARRISSCHPEIPYSLLGFHPDFFFTDLPPTSKEHAYKCEQKALEAGLRKVKIGNLHVLGNDY